MFDSMGVYVEVEWNEEGSDAYEPETWDAVHQQEPLSVPQQKHWYMEQ